MVAVHTFVHRLCIQGPGQWGGPAEAGADAVPTLSDQVRGGFGETRPGWAGSTKPRCGVHRGELGSADANKSDTCGSSGCPQVPHRRGQVFPACAGSEGPRQGVRSLGLTGLRRNPYRWAVEPVSTGAACPRLSRAGGRCQSTRIHVPVPLIPTTPDTRRSSREQAHVPAEQPSSSQGARLPPPDAHPRGPLHPVRASAQGSQEPVCLRNVRPVRTLC